MDIYGNALFLLVLLVGGWFLFVVLWFLLVLLVLALPGQAQSQLRHSSGPGLGWQKETKAIKSKKNKQKTKNYKNMISHPGLFLNAPSAPKLYLNIFLYIHNARFSFHMSQRSKLWLEGLLACKALTAFPQKSVPRTLGSLMGTTRCGYYFFAADTTDHQHSSGVAEAPPEAHPSHQKKVEGRRCCMLGPIQWGPYW